MTDQERYEKSIKELVKLETNRLKERNALEMQAEREFIGYVRREEDGRYSNEIISWGVNHGKIYGESIEAVKDEAFRIYG